MTNRIYQFKISLQGITPAVWRRIQVPEDYSFWDLHVAIQDAMGWLDYGLEGDPEIHPGWEESTICRNLRQGKSSLITRQYVGNGHFHKIKIL